MADDPEAEKYDRIITELSEQTDRGAAIIGAAILDDLLVDLLAKRLIVTGSLRERLFSYEKNGPLKDFNAKIDVAFAVGLISTETRNELHIVRRIRNHFAHYVEPITFEEEKITAWCNTLTVALNLPLETSRLRFLSAALRIAFILLQMERDVRRLEAIEETGGKMVDDAILGFLEWKASSPEKSS